MVSFLATTERMTVPEYLLNKHIMDFGSWPGAFAEFFQFYSNASFTYQRSSDSPWIFEPTGRRYKPDRLPVDDLSILDSFTRSEIEWGHQFDLIVCDAYVESHFNAHSREADASQDGIFSAQLVRAHRACSLGGTIIIKYFNDLMKGKNSLNYLTAIYHHYEEFVLLKPGMSNIFSGERYLILRHKLETPVITLGHGTIICAALTAYHRHILMLSRRWKSTGVGSFFRTDTLCRHSMVDLTGGANIKPILDFQPTFYGSSFVEHPHELDPKDTYSTVPKVLEEPSDHAHFPSYPNIVAEYETTMSIPMPCEYVDHKVDIDDEVLLNSGAVKCPDFLVPKFVEMRNGGDFSSKIEKTAEVEKGMLLLVEEKRAIKEYAMKLTQSMDRVEKAQADVQKFFTNTVWGRSMRRRCEAVRDATIAIAIEEDTNTGEDDDYDEGSWDGFLPGEKDSDEYDRWALSDDDRRSHEVYSEYADSEAKIATLMDQTSVTRTGALIALEAHEWDLDLALSSLESENFNFTHD